MLGMRHEHFRDDCGESREHEAYVRAIVNHCLKDRVRTKVLPESSFGDGTS